MTLTDSSTATLTIYPWNDAVIDHSGHPVRGDYVEQFWLGVLGPTATWLLRRLVAGFEYWPDGYELDLDQTARALGLNYVPGRVGPFTRSLERCVMFGYAVPVPYGLAVRRRLGTLTPRQVERLPDHLRRLHEHELRSAGLTAV